jgi:hypothetical protein
MRFKVLPRSQPVRTQKFGPFEIATIVEQFYDYGGDDENRGVAATAKFMIRHRGTPVTLEAKPDSAGGAAQRYDRANAVALLPGAPDALIVRAATSEDSGPVYLIIAEGDHVRTAYVSPGRTQLDAPLVTNDVARFRRARRSKSLRGVVDRTTFAEPGEFLFEGALLSTQPATVRRFTELPDIRLDPNVRPLGVSPDARQLVRVVFSEDYKSHDLVVTDASAGTSSFVPIDEVRTRVGEVSDLDPAWLVHYFAWVRGDDGQYRLEARKDVAPLPHRGVYSVPSEGYREYRVQPAGAAMYDAFIAFLTTEMGATRTPEDVAAIGYQMHVDGQIVNVMNNDNYRQVGMYVDRGTDPKLIVKIGDRFDAALATGKYDSLFTPPLAK